MEWLVYRETETVYGIQESAKEVRQFGKDETYIAKHEPRNKNRWFCVVNQSHESMQVYLIDLSISQSLQQ